MVIETAEHFTPKSARNMAVAEPPSLYKDHQEETLLFCFLFFVFQNYLTAFVSN